MNIFKLIILSCLTLSGFSYAANSQNQLKTQAAVSGTCSMVSNNVSFGQVDSFKSGSGSPGIAYWSTLNISVKCNNKLAYTISGMPYIREGKYTSKYLQGVNKGQKLSYGIWTGPNASGAWFSDGGYYYFGNGNSQGSMTGVISGVGTGNVVIHNLYFGLYPQIGSYGYPLYAVAQDNYVDNYTITLSY